MITDYPTKTCTACGGTTWWYTAIDPNYKGNPQWLCGVCFSPPGDIAKLRMRIMRGNWMLSQRRRDIDAMPNDTPEEHAIVLAERLAWGQGIDKLQLLGKELKQLNTDCLYIEKGKKNKPCIHDNNIIECFTCGNDYWPIQELNDLWFNKMGNR